MAVQASRASGSSEIAGDSESQEGKAALRSARKRPPRHHTGAESEPGSSAVPEGQLAGENGTSSEVEARAKRPSRKRRRAGAQGDVAAEGDEVDEAGGEADQAQAETDEQEFLGVQRGPDGQKAFAYQDEVGRRVEVVFAGITHDAAAELSDADSEVRPPAVITHSDWLASAAGGDEDFGDGSWRPGLEELRRKHVTPEPHESSSQEKPDSLDLVRLVQDAISDGDWKPILHPARYPDASSISAAVEQLRELELLAVMRACQEHLISQPWTETSCLMWAERVLSHASLRLAGHRGFRAAVRPLLRVLGRRLELVQPDRGIGACVGRWRLIVELGRVRRQAARGAQAGSQDAAAARSPAPAPRAAAAAASSAAAAEEAEPSSEEEDAESASDVEDGDMSGDDNEEAGDDAADGEDAGGAASGPAQVKALKALAGGAQAASVTNGRTKLRQKRLGSRP